MQTHWTGSRHVRFRYRTSKGQYADRDLLVDEIYEDGSSFYLAGWSYKRNARRNFRVDRIASELVDVQTGETGTVDELFLVSTGAVTPAFQTCQTAEALLAAYQAELEGLGWTVIGDETGVGLYRHYKNGKRLKHPDVVVEWNPEIVTVDLDDDLNFREERKPNPRPWRLSVRHGNSRNFGSFEAASVPFLEAAQPQGESA